MRYVRRSLAMAMLLVVAIACATSSLGKSIQAADFQKRVVEESAVEFIKLHMKGDPRITQAVYDEAKVAYGKWAIAQNALAQNLAMWKSVQSETNEQRLNGSLAQSQKAADAYLGVVGKVVNVEAVKARVGG